MQRRTSQRSGERNVGKAINKVNVRLEGPGKGNNMTAMTRHRTEEDWWILRTRVVLSIKTINAVIKQTFLRINIKNDRHIRM
jgi:hypothetical protein